MGCAKTKIEAAYHVYQVQREALSAFFKFVCIVGYTYFRNGL